MAQESRLAIIIDSRNARQQIDQLRNSLNGLQGAGGEATVNVRGLGTAARAAGGALAALGVGAVAREVIRLTDTFKSMQGSLALVSTSSENAGESFQKLLAMANNTGSSLESTVSLYTRLANATRGAGYSQEQLLGVTDAINKAFVISGATMQEASNAAIQLSQGLASGTLRGEELNSVMEQGPRITRALAEYLGVTNGQIRQMAADGKITGEVVTNALLKSLSSLNIELAQMPRKFEQASTALKNNFLAAIGQINIDPVISSVDALAASLAQPDVIMGIQSIANALGSVVAVGGDGLKLVATNTDALMAITGAYATKVGAGLVSSLALAAKARIADAAAASAQVVSSRQVALAAANEALAIQSAAVATAEASVAQANYARSQAASAAIAQASSVANIQAVTAQLVADRALETQRLQAQINDAGRAASLTRLAEIRLAEATTTRQQVAAEAALVVARAEEVAADTAATAALARLTALREASLPVVTAATSAQSALNASTLAGARGLALLGGPLGAVTLALSLGAAAYIFFKDSADAGTQSLINQNLTLDDSIEKFSKLTAEQKRYMASQWMDAQRDSTSAADQALKDYFNGAIAGFIQLGSTTKGTSSEFKQLFEEVKSGQRSLDSLTEWTLTNTELAPRYTKELERLGSEHSANSQNAEDYAKLLDRSKTASSGAADATKALADSQRAAAAAASGGQQAWDKYISQLTQTRDLIGANTAQEAAYSAAKAGFNTQQVEYSRLIGQQVDLLKKYEEAVKAGKKEDQDRLKVQLTASIAASDALKAQMESHGRSMRQMAENAEGSAKRQVDAIQTVIDQTVRYAKGLSLVETYQPKESRSGASLLTFGQEQPKQQATEIAKVKTAAEQAQALIDQIFGNTEAKASKTRTESGLNSKISAAATAFDNLYKAAQPAKFALQEYVEKQGQLELLLSKGKITQQQYNEALAQSSINYAAAIKGAQGLTQAEQYRAQLEKQLNTQRTQYSLEAAGVGMGDQQTARLQQRVQLEQQTNDRILQLRTELANATTEKQRQDLQAQIDLTEEFLPKQVQAMQAGWIQLDQQMLNASNGWTAALQNFQVSANDIAGQTQSMFSNAFQDISAGAGQAFESMIFDGMTFGDAMSMITENVLRGVVSALGEMAARWAVNAALNATLGASAAATNIALAGTTATAWAPAAAMASLATLGANAVPAAAALTSTTALSAGLAIVPGFATGGHVSGPGSGTSDSIPARLSNGEFVVNAQATKRNRALLEAINSNERVSVRGGGGRVIAQSNGSSGSGGGSSGGGGDLNIPIQVTVQAQPGMSEAEARRQGQQAGEGMRDIVRQVIQQEQRPGGMLA